jgi:predicted AlkP superfamily phosphohydrolase/phosphomutase
MTAKQYLQQAFRLNQRIESNREEIARLRALVTSIGSPDLSVDKVQGGGNQDRLGQTIAKIIDFERELEAEIQNYVSLRREIHNRINAIQEEDLKLILQKRYLNFQKWGQLAVDMNYSFRNVMYLHKQALNVFTEKFLSDETLHSISH